MIRSSEKGEVIVAIDNKAYNLSVNDEYVELLLKITSPDESIVFDEDVFSIDDASDSEYEEKLRRYSDFLKRFSDVRSKEIAEAKSQSAMDKRVSEIADFIEELKQGCTIA